jgi:hypothetical protein
VHVDRGLLQRRFAGSSCDVALSTVAIYEEVLRFQPASALHAVQQRIHGSGTQAVTVPAQLFDHALSEHWLVRGMMQHVDADKPNIEVLIFSIAPLWHA